MQIYFVPYRAGKVKEHDYMIFKLNLIFVLPLQAIHYEKY